MLQSDSMSLTKHSQYRSDIFSSFGSSDGKIEKMRWIHNFWDYSQNLIDSWLQYPGKPFPKISQLLKKSRWETDRK